MTIERKLEYDISYMKMALAMSDLSYSKRNKVGCIIVSNDGQVISQGYNGTPTGMDNECEYIDENGELKTKEEVLHAESNAISKCAKYRSSTIDSTVYVTLSPCLDCAKLIIQAGIKRVVYLDEYRVTDGIKLLNTVGILVQQIDMNNKSIKQINY